MAEDTVELLELSYILTFFASLAVGTSLFIAVFVRNLAAAVAAAGVAFVWLVAAFVIQDVLLRADRRRA
jgi:hypothetical protein